MPDPTPDLEALKFDGREVRAVRVTVEGLGVVSIEPEQWSAILAALERAERVEAALSNVMAAFRQAKLDISRLDKDAPVFVAPNIAAHFYAAAEAAALAAAPAIDPLDPAELLRRRKADESWAIREVPITSDDDQAAAPAEEGDLDQICECGHAKRFHALRSLGHFDCYHCRCDKFDRPIPEPPEEPE